MNKMEMDMKAMKAEIGGAFLVSWAIFSSTLGSGVFGTVEESYLWMALGLAVAWMTFAGAHVLPIVTWCHIMTGDLSDAEGNWMANGIRLLAQVIGACLAVALATEFGDIETGWEPTDMWILDIADNVFVLLGMVAAGAVWWQVHTRTDSAWVSGFALVMFVGALNTDGANEMAASVLGGMDGIVDTAVNWICDGLFVGVGALVGAKIDEML
tara:strand:- start:233 stop:868 length:636 start_codon:yes stop_codon:yes gene_type:complete